MCRTQWYVKYIESGINIAEPVLSNLFKPIENRTISTMLFLFLLQSSIALNLVEYENFEIEFNPNCTWYLAFAGDMDYVALNQTKGEIFLLIGRNMTYQTYSAPLADILTFTWPEKEVNGKKMKLVERTGEIQDPLSLNVSTMPCEVYGVRMGSLIENPETSSLTYQCPTTNSWKVVLPITLTIFISLVLAGGGYKTLRTFENKNEPFRIDWWKRGETNV